MPPLIAILVVVILFPDRPPYRRAQRTASPEECSELVKEWTTQPQDHPAFRYGARLLASCEVEIAPSIDH